MPSPKTCFLILTLSLATHGQAAEPRISAGRYHNLAIATDGAVYWWGNDFGVSFRLHQREAPKGPARVAGLPPIRAVAAGYEHSVAVAEDGAVYEWGFSPYQSHLVMMLQPVLGLCEITRIASGGHGKDPCTQAQIARAARMQVLEPQRIPGLPPASDVAATDSVTVMLSRDGDVYCWDPGTSPQRIPGLEKIKTVALGQFHGVALREDGAVLTWGGNASGELGHPSSSAESICRNPDPQVAFTQAVGIGAGVKNTYALRADGSIWGWGNNWSGQLGIKTVVNSIEPNIPAPRRIATVPDVAQLAAGSSHVIARTATGELHAWGGNSWSRLGAARMPESLPPIAIAPMDTVSAISAYDHNLALTHEGYLCTWGGNTYGETRPDSMRRDIPGPVPVMMADGVTPLSLLAAEGAARPAPARVCGDAQWQTRFALWDQAELQLRQRAERERALAKRTDFRSPIALDTTALIEATARRNQAAVARLLATGEADLDAQDGKGNTALMVAASGKQIDTVRLLLTKGANPQIKNLSGDTALSLAQNRGDSEAVQALQSAAK